MSGCWEGTEGGGRVSTETNQKDPTWFVDPLDGRPGPEQAQEAIAHGREPQH